jgi:hypothetical protein
MSITEERLRELGELYLNEKGKDLLEEAFLNDTLDSATIIILGALDGLWERGVVSEAEVAPLYRELDVDKTRASRLRQYRALNE